MSYWRCVLVSLALVLICGGTALAGSYPDRSVKMIVPYPPGGVTDGQARVVAAGLQDILGQPFVIENKAGASGAIAMEALKAAEPDGYTLLVFALSQAAILPATTKIKFEPVVDYAPVTNFGRSPQVLAINPDLPVKTPQELVAWSLTQPNPSYSSPGPGTTAHIAMAQFIQRTGMKGASVTVRGGPEALNNIMAGHIPLAFMNASDVVEQVKAGKVRALAVTSPQRIAQLPDTPTMIEAGYQDFTMVTWNGLAAPPGTPKSIVDALAAGVHQTLQIARNREMFAALVVTPVGNTSEEFTAEIKADITFWSGAVRASATEKSN